MRVVVETRGEIELSLGALVSGASKRALGLPRVHETMREMAMAVTSAFPIRAEECLPESEKSERRGPASGFCERADRDEQKAGPKRDVRSSVAVKNWWRETD